MESKGEQPVGCSSFFYLVTSTENVFFNSITLSAGWIIIGFTITTTYRP